MFANLNYSSSVPVRLPVLGGEIFLFHVAWKQLLPPSLDSMDLSVAALTDAVEEIGAQGDPHPEDR
ncbi:MAG: hypothetical protein DDT25_00347 [Chloroflexi bacterium]|nr:hypothetical protein [Chloroflexota bacterium]